MRSILLPLCLMLAFVPTTFAAKITTAEDLVQAMQKKYAKSWYQTATFVQRLPTSTRTEIRKSRRGTRRCLCPAHCA